MRLILKKDIDQLGEAGDVVDVSDGYGMNYLLPKNLALHASTGNVKTSQHEKLLREAQVQAAKRDAEDSASKFSDIKLEFHLKAGPDGRLFGSLTNRMIEEELSKLGIQIDRKKIILEEPIRKVGVFEIPIRLHEDVRPIVIVNVLQEEVEELNEVEDSDQEEPSVDSEETADSEEGSVDSAKVDTETE